MTHRGDHWREASGLGLNHKLLLTTPILAALLMLSLLLVSSPRLFAAEEALVFSSPDKKALYQKLTQELRCLKCQNQNLADSPAGLAEDLKQEIFSMVEAGKGSGEVIDFMVARYGDFILYRPAFKPLTAALWLAPFVLLGIGFMVIMRLSKPAAALAGSAGTTLAADGASGQKAPAMDTTQPEHASLARARALLDNSGKLDNTDASVVHHEQNDASKT